MKKFLVAMMLAILPTVADAAVTIRFTGLADSLTSYTRTVSSTAGESVVFDATPSAVSGTLVISLGLLTNQTGPSVYYDADLAAFLSGSFTSTGVTPAILSGGTPSHYVEGDAGTGTIEFGYSDAAAVGTARPNLSQFTLFGDNAPLITIGGIQLPDFANATNLSFLVSSIQGGQFDYVESYSAGTITAITVTGPTVAAAVPEPASWAMLILGFGLTGAALRRRRPARIAAA